MPDVPVDDELLDMTCPYALDALSESDRRTVERTLALADAATAAAFRSAVRGIQDTLADMTACDSVPAPPHVEEALLRALDAPGLAPRRARRTRWALAAAAVAVGIGAAVAVSRGHNPTASEITAQQVISHADTRSVAAPVAGGGTMTVHNSRELDSAAVSFDAVPPAPGGRVYQLWLVGGDRRPRPAGSKPCRAGTIRCWCASSTPGWWPCRWNRRAARPRRPIHGRKPRCDRGRSTPRALTPSRTTHGLR
ncbi:MAG: anti-sigma factor [Mycobacteriaceae bacterium]|nr:anti-sigma factor [Mycobacteriaceae bacterium]